MEKTWEKLFIDYLNENHSEEDASHDLQHFRRVYQLAKRIGAYELEAIDPLVILAAAYFHDIVSLPKDHVDCKMSSRYAAVKTKEILLNLNFPFDKIHSVCHAIETHSYSAQLKPQTLEAKIIQDADRMEALGALGIMRTFYVSGRLGRDPYDFKDMYAERRPLDDKAFGLDHFYSKLFKLSSTLQTKGGFKIGTERTEFLRYFVSELEFNIQKDSGGAKTLVWASYYAGRKGLKLFDPLDPKASKRSLMPERFVIDQMIAAQNIDQFSSLFLNQFYEETTLLE